MIERRTIALLVTVCLGHVLLISAQVQSRQGLPVIQVVAFDLFARVQRLTGGVADTGQGIWTHYFGLRGAARENDTLRRRILDLESELQKEKAVASETRALQQMLGLREQLAAPVLAARVIAGSPTPERQGRVTIDRGSADGIAPDMAVIGARGVVGRVIAPVAPQAATVQLLIDRNAAAAIVFERSSAGGMVVGGRSDRTLLGEYVPVLAEIQAGERVTTSGLDGIYPQGFLVGTVEAVTGAGPAREILVRPSTDYSHIDIVLVVLAPPATRDLP